MTIFRQRAYASECDIFCTFSGCVISSGFIARSQSVKTPRGTAAPVQPSVGEWTVRTTIEISGSDTYLPMLLLIVNIIVQHCSA